MKYSYRSKTYKLKNKLKILLTILLAVLISTTGYLLSRDVLSKLDYEYFNETTTDGINIKVVGERGVIPNNSILKIEKVTKDEKDSIDTSINEVKSNTMNIVESYTYDIKILDSNNKEIEPSDEINVIFTNDLINNKNLDTNIYHTSTDEENNLTTEVLKGEVGEDTITTKTDSFSYYTVEFTYNNLTYSIEGDSEVKLSSILEQVGLEGEVTSVEGSNDSLFSFEKKENEWYVKANQAFQTHEWMKVTIDNIVYEITVTDATNYTITYQSGSDGHFEGGATTNIVSYSLTTDQVTKYSHTPNVDDTGLQNGNYANSLNTNEVVTIPGSSTLTVDIYYNGESTSYDWLSVWAGNYPTYTADSDATSAGYVTTDMGAPDDDNKFGGSQSGSYTVNGNSLTNMSHTTLTISGDSVTFGFISDSSGAGKGYGYYAIVSGIGENKTITSGTYKEPIPNDADYIFKEWSQDPDTITTNTTLTATYVEDLLTSTSKGTYDGVDWKITYDGTLIIGKLGETQTYTNNISRNSSSWPWYNYRNQITGIDFIGTVNGSGSHCGMFYEFSNLMNITNVSNFITSKVINMSYMFYNCENLMYLNLSSFMPINVIDMSYMFYNCSDILDLDLSSFATVSVTNMSHMFYGCSSVTNLNLWLFSTYRVTDMSYMFYDCESLGNLDVTMFSTNNVTNMSHMFENCSGLTWLDLDNGDNEFNTSKVTDMSYMFAGAGDVYLSSFDTSKVTDMSYMFYQCKDMYIDVSNFNTSNVISMENMFGHCWGWSSADLSSFDTSNVTNMNGMFSACSDLTTLDLSSFDTCKVVTMNSMFEDCADLTSIYVSGIWNVGSVTSSIDMFKDCTSLVGGQNTAYDPNYVDASRAVVDEGSLAPGYLTYQDYNYGEISYAVFDSNDGTLTFFKDTAGKWYNKQVVGTKIYYYNVEKMSNAISWNNEKTLIQTVHFDDTIKPNSTAFWFDGCSSLINVDFTNLDTSAITDMSFMFNGCTNLTSLNLSDFNTDEVTTFESMFANCSSLVNVDLSSFNTYNVVKMASMFNGCADLINLDLSNIVTRNVKDMSNMFANCSSLTNLDLFGFDTNQVTNMSSMFENCTNLISIHVSEIWNVNSVVSSTKMFLGCTDIIGEQGTTYDINYVDKARAIIDGGSSAPGYLTYLGIGEAYAEFDHSTGQLRIFRDSPNLYTNYQYIDGKTYYTGIENITNETMPVWKEDYSGLAYNVYSVVIEDLFKPQTAYYLFSDFYNMESISGIENLDTGNVTNMRNMFSNCHSLESLDLSTFNTSKVTDMSNMFIDCDSLKFLDLSTFNTASVLDMSGMFSSCSSLEQLDLSTFETINVTNMNHMFNWCSSLTALDISTFKTDNVTDMSYMFSGVENIHELNLNMFDTSKVTDMSYMFYYADNLSSIYFYTWDTSNVENMSWMFAYCSNLNKLDTEVLETSSAINMSYMFAKCEKMVSCDVSGFDTSNVVDMSNMFWECGYLREIDVSSFNTSNVTNMSRMFSGCDTITGLQLNNFDTSNVTDMSYMFYGCNKIYHLDVSGFDTSSVVNMSGMIRALPVLYTVTLGTEWEFKSNDVMSDAWIREGDTTLYTAEELAEVYDASTMAGTYMRFVLLNVVETVKGDLADINKEFNFTITVLYDNEYINGTYEYVGTKTGSILFDNGKATFTLKHNETISIYLRYNSKYYVDQDSDGYTLSKSDYSNWLKGSKTATFTDTLNGTTPTGIFLDLIPYILLLFGSIFGVFWIKKFAKI